MRILFLAQCYAPEEVSAAVLITELAVDMAGRGHEVTMVTGAPNYPYGKVYPGYRNPLYQVQQLDGVRVIRTWSYISQRKSFLPRTLHYGTYSATAFYGGLLAGRPDIVVSYSPPLPLGMTAWLLSRIWRVPWVLQIEDLFPGAAIAAGMLTNRAAISFFSGMELFLYRRAERLSLISENFRDTIQKKGNFADKISVIPVWADPDEVRPMPRQNGFRQKYALTDAFVVMYAGNLGLTSCLEDVVAAAGFLQKDKGIRFVIVGEGVKKSDLEAEAHSKGLENLLFLPFQPRELFPEMMAAADVSLVTLNCHSAQTSLPSKIFNIMASARPILAVAPEGAEIASLVKTAKCGLVIPPAKPDELAEAIVWCKQQDGELSVMGENGRSVLEAGYSRKKCVDRYEEMLLDLCSKGRPRR
jgi:colanic acid biosynthesis glycosyl transferase WcaI